jgi:colicin import membrane protein
LLSALFHLFILGLIILDLTFFDQPKKIQAGPPVKTIKAEVIDLKQLEAVQKEKNELAAKRKKEQEKKKKALAAKKRAEQKKKKDAEKKRKAEQASKAEQKRKKQAAEKKKQEAAKLKAAEKNKAEQKRKAEQASKAEEKRKLEQAAKIEAQRKADEKRKAEEAKKAEEKRVAEEARRKQEELERKKAEQRRLAEEEQRRKEADLKAKLLAEENQRRLSSLQQDYIQKIRQRVERNWLKPPGSGKMPVCEVHVIQGPGGIVLDVTFGACPGSTAAYRKSIEHAVLKADPLPAPEDPALFDRELKFLFKPPSK